MKLTATEFISKAEGLKSSELSAQQRIESIKSRRSSTRGAIETQQYRIESLRLELESLENQESDENGEGGEDNSERKAAIMAEIASANEMIESYEEQDAELKGEQAEAEAELRSIEMEEQQILSEIADSAARVNQNIALISAYSGDYSNVSSKAESSFQHNLGQLSQAAQILGGSIPTSVPSGAGGGARTTSAHGGGYAGSSNGSNRNFYEAANNQRNAGAQTSGTMGAKSATGGSTGRNGANLYSTDSAEDEMPKKTGGLGQKPKRVNQILDKPGVSVHPFANTEEKDTLIRNASKEWASGLSEDEYSAIRDYTRAEPNYYKNINKKLRGKALFFDVGNKERAVNIHNALQRAQVPCDCTVYRGTSIDALGKYKNLSDEELIGKVILDKGFMSTSIKKGSEFGGEVKLEILVSAGAKGAYLSDGISAVGKSEHELLFDKGSRMKIIGVSYDMWHNRTIQARLM